MHPLTGRRKHSSRREAADEVLVDYGSGAGRVVLMAARLLPFKAIVGVELLPSLVDLAERNRKDRKSRLLCQDTTFVESDAVAYALPPEVTKVFFFTPFAGPVLEAVLDGVQGAMRVAPWPLTIVFLNPGRAQPIIDQCPWMRPTLTLTDLCYPCRFFQVEAA